MLLGLAAHGYCYLNLLYSHDALHLVPDSDSLAAQIGLGRFFNPLYLQFRGLIGSSSLVGLLSLCYLAVTIWLIVTLLDIRQHRFIFCSCCVLTTNTTVTLLNASYIGLADIFMLALLCSVLAVYLLFRYRYGFFAAPVLLCLSLGLYQSYFQVAVFLCMLLLAKQMLDNVPVKKVLGAIAKSLFALFAGLLLYKGALQLALYLTDTAMMDSYNGLTHVGQFASVPALLQLLKQTWLFPVQYYLAPPSGRQSIIAACNLLLLVLLAVALLYKLTCQPIAAGNLLLLALTLLLMPFGINVVYFIANGLEHALMLYSFSLIYLLPIYLLDENTAALQPKQRHRPLPAALKTTAFVCIICLTFHNVSFANQLYLKKHLEFQSTLSVMTRIIDRIEQTDGYLPGQTPVALIGALADSPLSQTRPGFAELTGVGCSQNFSTTYFLTYKWYFEQLLAYPIQLLEPEQIAPYLQSPQVQTMPSFPQNGCCALLDGVLVLKLSAQ